MLYLEEYPVTDAPPAEKKPRSKRIYVMWGAAIALLLVCTSWFVGRQLHYNEASRRYRAIRVGMSPEEVAALFQGYKAAGLTENPFEKLDADQKQSIQFDAVFWQNTIIVLYRKRRVVGKFLITPDPLPAEDFPYIRPPRISGNSAPQ